MVPSLLTLPAPPPLVKMYLPDRKLESEMLRVDATMPPTSTCEPRPNSTPFGLTRNSCPFDDKRPKISEALLPSTRLSAIDEAFGCWNTTEFPAPMEKVCQLRIAFWEVWLTCSEEAFGAVIVAVPAATWPPVGSTCANAGVATLKNAASRAG